MLTGDHKRRVSIVVTADAGGLVVVGVDQMGYDGERVGGGGGEVERGEAGCRERSKGGGSCGGGGVEG